MDPNANYRKQVEIAKRIQRTVDADRPVSEDDAADLADHVVSLHEWIAGGGFPPDAFSGSATKSRRRTGRKR